MGLMADEILKPAQCSADGFDFGADQQEEQTDEPRELVLVDAGDLAVRLGDASVQVPLSLVPDLLFFFNYLNKK
jgi:hypothetical protein